MVGNRGLIIVDRDFSSGKLTRLSSTCKLEQRVLDHLLVLNSWKPTLQASNLDPESRFQVAAVQIVEAGGILAPLPHG